jgi:hypothetical protein
VEGGGGALALSGAAGQKMFPMSWAQGHRATVGRHCTPQKHNTSKYVALLLENIILGNIILGKIAFKKIDFVGTQVIAH